MENLLKLEHELDASNSSVDLLQYKDLCSALVLPLFGWNFCVVENRQILKCDLCFRALGLWKYDMSDSVVADLGNISGSLNSIDAEKEHRPYCPWINRSHAQITTMPTPCYSARVPGQAICGWEFMLDMATIEGKHLEEMYDLSPKAEQQRSRLHQEARNLMKAARSRLSQVLNGDWKKRNLPTSEREHITATINEVQTPELPALPSPSLEIKPASLIELPNEQIHPAIEFSDLHVQDVDESMESNVRQVEVDVKSENVKYDIHPDVVETAEDTILQQESPTETTIEIQPGAELPSLELASAKNAISQKSTFFAPIRDATKVTSPGSSLDVNLSTVSTPNELEILYKVSDNQVQEEEETSVLVEDKVTDEMALLDEFKSPSVEDADADALNATDLTEPTVLPSSPPPSIPVTTTEAIAHADVEEMPEGVGAQTATPIASPTGDEEAEVTDDIADHVEHTTSAHDTEDNLFDEGAANLEQTELHAEEQVADSIEAEEAALDDGLEGYSDQVAISEAQQSVLKEEADVHETTFDENAEQQNVDLSINEIMNEGLSPSIQLLENTGAEYLDLDQAGVGTPDSTMHELSHLQGGEIGTVEEDNEPTSDAAEDDTAMYEASHEFEEAGATHATEQSDELEADTTTDHVEIAHTELQSSVVDDNADFVVDESQLVATPDFDNMGIMEDDAQHSLPATSVDVHSPGSHETLTVDKQEAALSPLPYDEDQYDESAANNAANDSLQLPNDASPDADFEIDVNTEGVDIIDHANDEDNGAEIGGDNSMESEQQAQDYIDNQLQADEVQQDTIGIDDETNHPSAVTQPSPDLIAEEEADNDDTGVSDDYVVVEAAADVSTSEQLEAGHSQTASHEMNSASIAAAEKADDIEGQAASDTNVNSEKPSSQEPQPEVVVESENHHTDKSGEQQDAIDLEAAPSVENNGNVPIEIEDTSPAHTSSSPIISPVDDENAPADSKDEVQVESDSHEADMPVSDVHLMSAPENDVVDDSTLTAGDTEATENEEFYVIDENDYQQSEEDSDVIAVDTLPILESDDTVANDQLNDDQVSVEVGGGAIIEFAEPQSSTIHHDIDPSESDSAYAEEGDQHEIESHVQTEDDQLDEYIDNDQLEDYLEEKPGALPKPGNEGLVLVPLTSIAATAEEADVPSSSLESDAHDVDTEVNNSDTETFTMDDDIVEQNQLQLEQPMEDVKNPDNNDSTRVESLQAGVSEDHALTPASNTIESELQDSTMLTEEYNEDSNMFDME